MKGKVIIINILVFALLLSACVGPFTSEDERTPSSSDTSPVLGSSEYTDPAETESAPTEVYCTPTYLTDSRYYRHIDVEIGGIQITGWTLEECPDGVEYAVIPSHIDGVPVVGIGYRQSVFGDFPSIKKIEIPETVQYIGNFAFSRCSELADFTLPSGIKYIGICAFDGCSGLKELRITADMEISIDAVTRASGLEKVIIEEGVTSVPFFNGCSSLTEITLPSTITEMGMDGSDYNEPHFAGTQITFIELPEGLTYLGWYVFQGCDIESIVLPSTLRESSEVTFDTDALKYVFFRGTEDQLLDKVRETIHAPIYYLSETEPTEEGNFWHYVDGKPVIW